MRELYSPLTLFDILPLLAKPSHPFIKSLRDFIQRGLAALKRKFLNYQAHMSGETLIDCLTEGFRSRADKMAVTFLREGLLETGLSYGDLDRDTNRMAHTLIKRGVRKGDRVVLYLPKSLAFVVVYLAVQKIGAIGVPLNPGFKHSEMIYLLDDAEANLVIAGTEQEAILQEIDPRLNRITIATERPYHDLGFFRTAPPTPPGVAIGTDDPGLIIYTSGTTGQPKGAVLTQGNLIHDARNIIQIWEITERDVLCHALPLFHIHGLCFALHTALMAGAHIIMLDGFNPETVLEVLSRSKGDSVCTVFMAVPAMYGRLMDFVGDKRPDFNHMRLWTSGSAPLLARDFGRIKEVFGKEPVEREGMSETGMNFSNPVQGTRKPGSIGVPLPGLEVRVVNPETMADVEPGHTGEFWLKGPAITPGYWRKPDETAKAFRDGWFRTGDLGRVDDDGYYYLTDRIKHIIISGGENVSPKEIETVINRLDGVVESSVVGIPDERWGEKVVAAVVAKPGSIITEREVQAYCKTHLHDWKCPKQIVFTAELPKNRMGKILKEEVKDLFKT
jgi:malonyl-CoA/methylmalonyl-CoA synthetase